MLLAGFQGLNIRSPEAGPSEMWPSEVEAAAGIEELRWLSKTWDYFRVKKWVKGAKDVTRKWLVDRLEMNVCDAKWSLVVWVE